MKLAFDLPLSTGDAAIGTASGMRRMPRIHPSGWEGVGVMANADTYEQAASTRERPERAYKIIVNGRPKTVEIDRLSFEEVVALAFDPVPSGPNVAITVTYRRAAQRPDQGMLSEGQTVKIKNGTVFNVTATDKS